MQSTDATDASDGQQVYAQITGKCLPSTRLIVKTDDNVLLSLESSTVRPTRRSQKSKVALDYSVLVLDVGLQAQKKGTQRGMGLRKPEQSGPGR